MRIFLDANILFSAAKSDGASRTLVDRLLAAGHECWMDAYVIDEARRNILAKQPNRVADVETLVARLRVATEIPDPTAVALPDDFPEKDRPVLAAAVMLGCQVLVTGDRSHFGPLFGRLVANVTIHSPRSLFELLFEARPPQAGDVSPLHPPAD